MTNMGSTWMLTASTQCATQQGGRGTQHLATSVSGTSMKRVLTSASVRYPRGLAGIAAIRLLGRNSGEGNKGVAQKSLGILKSLSFCAHVIATATHYPVYFFHSPRLLLLCLSRCECRACQPHHHIRCARHPCIYSAPPAGAYAQYGTALVRCGRSALSRASRIRYHA